MHQITKHPMINEVGLDQGFYFQALFSELLRKECLNQQQAARIQMELLDLLTKQTLRYTNEESSSVRVETAQQLLQSITYCLGVALKKAPDTNSRIELLSKEKLSVLFYRGFDILAEYIAKSKAMLKELQSEVKSWNNIAYRDTLSTAIPDFFHDYNMEFAAFDIPCSIDYPLCHEVKELLGAEYIYEYLRRCLLEYKFCRSFSTEVVNRLISCFSEDAAELLINVFELVLTNALGCIMAGTEAKGLLLKSDHINWLQLHMESYHQEELSTTLASAYDKLCAEYEFEEDLKDYAKAFLPQIADRMKINLQTKTLDKLLLIPRKQSTYDEISYIEGEAMEDKALRELIDDISSCRSTEEKLALVKERVHSLSDFVELLELCFFGQEFSEIFQLLNNTELSLLKQSIPKSLGPKEEAEYEPEKEWQIRLLEM